MAALRPANVPLDRSRRAGALLAVSLFLAALPAGARGDTTERTGLLGYHTAGWRFLEVPYGQGPENFQERDFGDNLWPVGVGGFGTLGGCPQAPVTPWLGRSDLLLRIAVSVPASTRDVRIHVMVDDDVQVFFNGVDVSGGLRTKEGCAQVDDWSFPVPDTLVEAGPNLLAIRARDRGVAAFVDARVDALVPECADRRDNDGDGLIDHPLDPGCGSATDGSESPDPPPPVGTPGAQGTIAFTGMARLPQFPCPASYPGQCGGGSFEGDFSGSIAGVHGTDAYEIAWSSSLAPLLEPGIGAVFEYGEFICVTGTHSFAGTATGTGTGRAAGGQVVGRWYVASETPGAPHAVTNLSFHFDFTWLRAGTSAVLQLTDVVLEVEVTGLGSRRVIETAALPHTGLADFVPHGSLPPPGCDAPAPIQGEIHGLVQLHA